MQKHLVNWCEKEGKSDLKDITADHPNLMYEMRQIVMGLNSCLPRWLGQKFGLKQTYKQSLR